MTEHDFCPACQGCWDGRPHTADEHAAALVHAANVDNVLNPPPASNEPRRRFGWRR